MKCQGKFKFKGISKRNGGSFTNSQGEIVNYSESYILKVDEFTEKGIFERVFKLSIDSPLVSQLSLLKPYDDIILDFDVILFGSSVRVIPVALKK